MLRMSLIAGLAMAGALSAAGAKPLTPSKIAACVDAAQTIDAMRRCKRIVFKPCVKEPDNLDATIGLVMCNDREGGEWQALLDARTAALAARDQYRAEALKAATDAWRAWVDAECAYHRAEAMGGSAETVITTECTSDLTADRAIALTWQLRGNLPY